MLAIIIQIGCTSSSRTNYASAPTKSTRHEYKTASPEDIAELIESSVRMHRGAIKDETLFRRGFAIGFSCPATCIDGGGDLELGFTAGAACRAKYSQMQEKK